MQYSKVIIFRNNNDPEANMSSESVRVFFHFFTLNTSCLVTVFGKGKLRNETL